MRNTLIGLVARTEALVGLRQEEVTPEAVPATAGCLYDNDVFAEAPPAPNEVIYLNREDSRALDEEVRIFTVPKSIMRPKILDELEAARAARIHRDLSTHRTKRYY